MLNRLAFIFCLDVALFFASQIGFALKINGIRQVNAVNFFFFTFSFLLFFEGEYIACCYMAKISIKTSVKNN